MIKFFCTHKRTLLRKYRGPIRLRQAQMYWECQDCFAQLPTAFSPEVTKVFEESLKKGLTNLSRSI